MTGKQARVRINEREPLGLRNKKPPSFAFGERGRCPQMGAEGVRGDAPSPQPPSDGSSSSTVVEREPFRQQKNRCMAAVLFA